MRRDEAAKLDAVIERGRVVARVPDAVRARVLARARGAMVETKSAMPPPPLPSPRRRHLLVALAASLALAIATASAVAAFRAQERDDVPPAAPSVHPSPVSPRRVGLLVPAPSQPAPPPAEGLAAPPERAAHPRTARASYAAELELLHRAQAAQATRRFPAALALVDEHARRFPAGRLVEEREALRVRALAGAGRTDEAGRAAAAFAQRFPRSVFLPRLGVLRER